MIELNIKYDSAQALEALDSVKKKVADRTELHQELARGVEKAVKDNFLRLGGKKFWAEAAESTHVTRHDAHGATVSITKIGVALRRWGGRVKASGETSEVTGHPIKNLSIPLSGEPPVAEFGGLLKWIPNRSAGGKATGFLVDAEERKLRRGARKGQVGRVVKEGGEYRYALVEQTEHQADERVLPSDSALEQEVVKLIGLYLELEGAGA